MIKKTITYVDFNGIQRTDDFYFNLSKSEIGLLEISEQYRDGENQVAGGFSERLKRVGASASGREIIDTFTELIERSYGVKSADGRRFQKNPELFEEFRESAAYDTLMTEILTTPEVGIELIKGAMPSPDGDSPNVQQSATVQPQAAPQAPQMPQILPQNVQPYGNTVIEGQPVVNLEATATPIDLGRLTPEQIRQIQEQKTQGYPQ